MPYTRDMETLQMLLKQITLETIENQGSLQQAKINNNNENVHTRLLCGTNVRMRTFLAFLTLCVVPKPRLSGFLGLWDLNLYCMFFFLKSIFVFIKIVTEYSGLTKFHLKI